MFFPLLESLLQKDSVASKAHVRTFLRSDEDPKLLYKSLFSYAAQQDTNDTRNPNALVACEALTRVAAADLSKREWLIGNVIDFLCAIPVVSADTSVLKPVKGETKVVSIYDLDEAFGQPDIEKMFMTVRDILSLMDNKQYFMELVAYISLNRSPQTIVLAQATANAIGIMDWKNNFTPFLIYHLVKKVFLDPVREAECADGNVDENVFQVSQISSTEDAQLASACFQMASTGRIIARKLKPKAAVRFKGYFDRKDRAKWADPCPWIDSLTGRAALQTLSHFPESERLKSKFPL